MSRPHSLFRTSSSHQQHFTSPQPTTRRASQRAKPTMLLVSYEQGPPRPAPPSPRLRKRLPKKLTTRQGTLALSLLSIFLPPLPVLLLRSVSPSLLLNILLTLLGWVPGILHSWIVIASTRILRKRHRERGAPPRHYYQRSGRAGSRSHARGRSRSRSVATRRSVSRGPLRGRSGERVYREGFVRGFSPRVPRAPAWGQEMGCAPGYGRGC